MKSPRSMEANPSLLGNVDFAFAALLYGAQEDEPECKSPFQSKQGFQIRS